MGAARPGPGGPRSCGCWSRRCARRGRACRGSWPGTSSSPGSRQSNPAACSTSSMPSASAWALTAWLPGTTSVRTPLATVRPSATAATARRSSMRPLVHEPMNTVSTGTSRSGVPAVRPMYSRARAAASRSEGSAKLSGSGTAAADGRDLGRVGAPGDVGDDLGGVEVDRLVEGGAVVGGQAAPVVERPLPGGARRGVGAALEVGERGVVGGDEAGLGAGLDRHVAHGHAALHREGRGWPSRGTR